uniref:C-type lectin domain-containing protein n=1 Tax=Amphiprion ocellaris TaxID=80972 RepID=A0AAQ5X9I1_AMPOC
NSQIYLSEATTTALIGCLLLLQVYKRHLTGRKLHRRFLILTVLYQVACGLFGQNVYVQQRSTWSEARQYCRQHHTDLTSVDTTEEIIALLLEAQKKDLVLPNMWIGLYKDVNHTWKWSGGTNISHQFWPGLADITEANLCVHISNTKSFLCGQKYNTNNNANDYFKNTLILIRVFFYLFLKTVGSNHWSI